MAIAGINPDENLKKLAESMKLFETSHHALTEGDAAMNIPACEFPDISEQLEKVSILYAELDKIFDKMVEGEKADSNDMQHIAKASLPLLTAADKAVKLFEAEAIKVLTKDPTLALVINIAGRQRMLSQKMAKEALLIHLKVDATTQAESLQKTTTLFETSLKGLQFGDSEVGIPPTKEEDIKAQLETVGASWTKVKPILEKIMTQYLNYAISKDDVVSVVDLTGIILKESDKAVGMYEKVAK